MRYKQSLGAFCFVAVKGEKGAMDNTIRVKMLEKPTKSVDVVFDSDTYNEIDDQYALAYLVKSNKELSIKAIYAAPFYLGQLPPDFYKNRKFKSDSPGDGMEKSYREIMNILTLLDAEEYKHLVHYGSTRYLTSEKEPVISQASEDLAKRAMDYSSDNPLYVIAIGAITNIASALLLNPEIKERMVVVWLGGHSHEWPNTLEFNMAQDIAAARVVFGCGVPLVQLPCKGVVSAFTLSAPELDCWMLGKNKLCDYLVGKTKEYAKERGLPIFWKKPIWDVTAVAWLINERFMEDRFTPTPIPTYDYHYAVDKSRPLMKYVYHINSELIIEDMIEKLTS